MKYRVTTVERRVVEWDIEAESEEDAKEQVLNCSCPEVAFDDWFLKHLDFSVSEVFILDD